MYYILKQLFVWPQIVSNNVKDDIVVMIMWSTSHECDWYIDIILYRTSLCIRTDIYTRSPQHPSKINITQKNTLWCGWLRGWKYYWFIGIAQFNPSDSTLQLHTYKSCRAALRGFIERVCPWKHDYNWIEVGMVVVVVAMVQQRDVDDKDTVL